MSDQEIVATAVTQAETSTLFDELAGLVPEERLTEYYRVIAHTRTLSPNDEMLRVLQAMGVLALLTRETPAAIAAERKQLRSILESSASQARGVERRMEAYSTRHESRLTQLPKELETGLDPPRIAKLLSESLRQCFQRSGLPDTGSALSQSCAELNSVQKQLLNVLREVAHPDVGIAARTRSANDSLVRNMAARAQQMDNYLVRLEKQVWSLWLPVVAAAALIIGFVFGAWYASVPKVTSAISDTPVLQQRQAQTPSQPQVIPQRGGKRH
jgi:hypothetical protein